MEPSKKYQTYREIFRDQRLPLAFIDLDAFDSNIAYVAQLAKQFGKTIRLGSKSIRSVGMIQRIFNTDPTVFRGILTFTVEESAWLASLGFDDLIVAYPSVQPIDMALMVEMTQAGKKVRLMADSEAHLIALSEAGEKANLQLHACLEVDMAYRPLGLSSIHLGVRRSPLRSPEQALQLVEIARNYPGVVIDALMGYEGHIASINDDVPGANLKNRVYRALKNLSVRELTERRDQVVKSIRAAGAALPIVNGGGSGSLVSTGKDPLVTEITVGSGFYASGLFHHFKEVRFQPSAFFALQIVRIPTEGMITCHGGGYIASGEVGLEKQPLPMYPAGLEYLSLEGAGEVQTPFVLPKDYPDLRIGDPIFLQHAKAGELCERFNELYLIKEGKIVDKVNTYRGDGKAFL
jgi:D-serine deaminase-like pyridoxal phosphate-dependent protein